MSLDMYVGVNLTDAMYPQYRRRTAGPRFVAVCVEKPLSGAWMMIFQALSEIFFHVDKLRVQPCHQGTMIFGLVASRHPFFKTSHAGRCLVSNPVDAT